MRVRGRDQLIVCGVYAHIGCQLTAAEAFQRDIEPFFVADALGDFSRDKHMGAVTWAADTCALTPQDLTLERMRADVAAVLHETPDSILDDDNLMDLGVDSLRALNLSLAWSEAVPLEFSEL
ncbi:hypothetical protein LTR94_032410, partial [Friedmanniomyces endolithicus]